MYKFKQIGPALYEIPKEGGMRVPGLIVANEEILQDPHFDEPLQQVRNVAHLPGIVGYSIAMPDIHWGYGFPIGGVAAMDAEHGVISPGGVGYDINCGVRLALAPEQMKNISPDRGKALLKRIFELVPSGVGHGQKKGQGLSERDYEQIAQLGAKWSIDRGAGFASDLEHMESRGLIEGASSRAVSTIAKERGKLQLGTIGSGNHFVEIGRVETIFLPEIASAWKVEVGQVYVLIHSGSRGFGHQVCQDTLDQFIKQGFAENLPDKQLVAAPIRSAFGEQYFHAMALAANYAFNNRQQILTQVRQAFNDVLHIKPEAIALLYDVCHNIAKFETHMVNGHEKNLCVHRKGATRALGPGAQELNPLFKKTGQPVLVPGDMGRASYLLVGSGNPLTWCSCCHGAGRARSRIQSAKLWKDKDIHKYLADQGISVMAESMRTIVEEMPDAYKNVKDVVKAVEDASLAKRVAELRPLYVVKG